jgi:hypothetical protein
MTTSKSNTVECYICKQQKNPNDCWANRARGKLQNYNCVKPCGQSLQPQPKTPPLPTYNQPTKSTDTGRSWFFRLFGIGKVVEEKEVYYKPKALAPAIELKTTYVTFNPIQDIVDDWDGYETEEDKPLIKQLGGLRKRVRAL